MIVRIAQCLILWIAIVEVCNYQTPMEEILTNLKNCQTLRLDQDGLVTDWVTNMTTTTTIDIDPYPRLPHTTYNKLNETHYQWCGTMMLIIEHLAKYTKNK